MKKFRTKEERKEHRKELFLKYFGYGFFAVIFTVLCIGVCVLLPSDAAINSEVTLFDNKTENDSTEETWQKSGLVNPAEYHTKAIQHQKVDMGLQLYRDEISRQSVVWFYNQITNNEDVTLAILKEADKNDIPLSLAFALAWTESSYRPNAENGNTNHSIDRGLFQLNNKSFPDLDESDFFDPYTSAKYGLSHLKFCMETAGNEVSALAMYNAGTTKVRNNRTPQVTLNYVSKIMNYQEGLDSLFESQVVVFYRTQQQQFYLASATK